MSGPSSSSGPTPLDPQAQIQQMQTQMQQMQQHYQAQATTHSQQLAAAQQQAAAAVAAAAAPRPIRPKLAPAMHFGGSGNVEPFIRVMEQHMQYYGMVNEADRLQFVFGHLDGAALVWINKLAPADRPTTWAEFLACFYQRYRPVEEKLIARIKLDNLKQGKYSVTAYTNQVQTLLSGINDMSEADQVHHYVTGLNPAIMSRVLERHPRATTLVAVIEQAAGIEASQGLMSRTGSHYGNRSSNYSNASSSSDSVPMDINNVNHDENDEDSVSAPRFHDEPASRNIESALMAKLEAMEHKLAALQNFSAPKAFSKDTDRVSGLKSGDINRLMKEGKCFRCQKTGHMKSECPQGKNVSFNSKPKSSNY